MGLWLWIFMLESSLSISQRELRDLCLQWSNFAMEGMPDNSGLDHSITHFCCILFWAIFINGFLFLPASTTATCLQLFCFTWTILIYAHISIHLYKGGVTSLFKYIHVSSADVWLIFNINGSTVIKIHVKSSHNKLQHTCAYLYLTHSLMLTAHFWEIKYFF